MKRILMGFVFLLFLLPVSAYATTYYVDATEGNDASPGTSLDYPLKTITKVNSMSFQPGDFILFKRGEVWREQLIPYSGDQTGQITYGVYGEGPKPLLLGSAEKNNPHDWMEEEENIWILKPSKEVGEEILPNPSFDSNDDFWFIHEEGGADVTVIRDINDYDSYPASYSIECLANGSEQNHIQLYTRYMNITKGKYYKLTFRAKSTHDFTIQTIKLMKASSPWNRYYYYVSTGDLTITSEWKTYEIMFKSGITASDARITFYLGDVLPQGAVFNIDTLSFRECVESGGFDADDVGNLIFNNEGAVGVRVYDGPEYPDYNNTALDEQGEFIYNRTKRILKLYSETNPTDYYSDIECALDNTIILISGRSHVTIENLDLRYGAGCGVNGHSSDHIIIRDCDFSYIGGDVDSLGRRGGNAIQFWENAHDNIVERNRIWEVYDAGVTNQGLETNYVYNLTYRNNIIWNVEYCFELWNRPNTSKTNNVSFDNNICFNIGDTWAHNQRPKTQNNGFYFTFYFNTADTQDIYVRNNIFYNSSEGAIRVTEPWDGLEDLVIDYNCWYQPSDTSYGIGFYLYVYDRQNKLATISNFSEYQEMTGKDENSIWTDPFFVDKQNRDFHLLHNSPCIDAGIDIGTKYDFDGVPIPQGSGPDIGAYEYIEAPCDFNGDGDVDIQDLIEVTLRFGLTGSDLGWNGTIDVVTNGEIDIYDMVYVASRFTESDLIYISANLGSGGTGTPVSIPISVMDNTNEISAFGLDMTYDTNMFNYVNLDKGDLTSHWGWVDANEVIQGTVIIGGIRGSETPVPASSDGSIAIANFVVTCSACSSGSQSQICISNYDPGLAGLGPEPTCTTFTYV